jgi:hypothetical protein
MRRENTPRHSAEWHSVKPYAECCYECCYAECHHISILMLIVIVFSVVRLNFIVLSVIMLRVILLSVIMLRVILLSVIMFSVIILCHDMNDMNVISSTRLVRSCYTTFNYAEYFMLEVSFCLLSKCWMSLWLMSLYFKWHFALCHYALGVIFHCSKIPNVMML